MHTFITFWLDFEGLRPSWGLKKREKTASKKSSVFRCEKKATQSVFYDFGLHFRVFVWIFLGEGLRDRFGTPFGSILEVFWTDFGSIFSIILDVFL